VNASSRELLANPRKKPGMRTIFSADSNKRAFYIGASILALMMTAVPYKALPNLNTSPLPNPAGATIDPGWWDRFLIPPQVFAQNSPQSSASSPFIIHLETVDKKPVTSAIFMLIDPGSGQTIRRSRVQGSDLTFYVDNRPPRQSPYGEMSGWSSSPNPLSGLLEPRVGSKPQNPAKVETTGYAQASRRAFDSQQRCRLP
jgi:hypothetical protein